MKQSFYFVSALLLALALLSCPSEKITEEEEEETFTLDQRLVGGMWLVFDIDDPSDDITLDYPNLMKIPDINIGNPDDRHYYRFTYNTENSAGNVRTNFAPHYYMGAGVRSENGIVYIGENKWMEYEFHDQFPFPDLRPGFFGTPLNKKAAAGDLITYRLYNQEDGTLYDDGRPIYKWLLIRFKER
jgi:hypothetical protein